MSGKKLLTAAVIVVAARVGVSNASGGTDTGEALGAICGGHNNPERIDDPLASMLAGVDSSDAHAKGGHGDARAAGGHNDPDMAGWHHGPQASGGRRGHNLAGDKENPDPLRGGHGGRG